MFFPKKQKNLTLAILISFFMTQDACATKRVAPPLDGIEQASEQRRRLTPEVTFESRLKADYDQRWARCLKTGLERRQDFLSRNTTYQACESVKYRLQWILKNQGIFVFSFPLKMRNSDFLSQVVGCKKGVCRSYLSQLFCKNLVTKDECCFFLSKTVKKKAFDNIVAALRKKGSYESVITIMAQDGIFKIKNSRLCFLQFLSSRLRKNHFPGAITRSDWDYLKQRKTADVHKDPELRVKELVRQQLEELVGEGVKKKEYLASKYSSNTLQGDFLNRFEDKIQRKFSDKSYRAHIRRLIDDNMLSPAARELVTKSSNPFRFN